VAQRRLCSVLFCDLVGFTPLSEARDPEEVRELLSQYFETARTVIGRYGGAVEKFIGDAVMAVWGAPTASEGDAERAVRAALDVVAAVAQLGAESGVEGLAARAGVVTGEVAVTLGATNEGMVAGDAVNTAARVQAAARAGTVLVDTSTRRLAASAIGFDDAGQHMLKGKVEPEQLWRATRVLSGVGGAQRVDGLEAPLTGRDAELRLVKELFHAAAERRVPRLLVVSGPAGVGKSRLGWEFEKYVDGLKNFVRWHRGRCLSYGDGVSFWALVEIVRQRFGIAEEDPPDVAASRLAEGLPEFVPDLAEQVYVGARLARLLGLQFAGDVETPLAREELFAGWRLFFERLAELEPVLLLIEDAQYADAGLLDFVDHLIDWSRDLPIFVMLFARPELEQTRPGLGTGRNRTALTLDPLDAPSMDSLVNALVPDMPDEARHAITQQAQGIPLFAVETVRSLIDRDIVQPIDGVYRLVGDVGELVVPNSLHALLAARLDALAPDVQTLVADAAVLGSTFPAEALIAVSGREEQFVRAALAELLRREVFAVSADPLSPERGSYRFAQEMLRQVAYDTLSRRDRKTRHLSVAAHLRATFAGDGDEVMDVVARHYLDALAAVPDDGDSDELRAQAVAALIRAGERAARTGAPASAALSYSEAAALSGPLVPEGAPAAADLWLRAAIGALDSSQWDVALDHAERARLAYLADGDQRGAARAMTRSGQALRRSGRLAEARAPFESALEILRSEPDADTVAALGQLATLEVLFSTPQAGQHSEEGLLLCQALDLGPGIRAPLLVTHSFVLLLQSRRAEAVMYLKEAERLAALAGDNAARGSALMNLSNALVIDDPVAATVAAKTAADTLRRTGVRLLFVVATQNQVMAQLASGDWDGAESLLEREADYGLAGTEYFRSFQAWLAAMRGNAELAEAMLRDSAGLRSNEDPQNKAILDVIAAFIALANKRPDDALRLCMAALEYVDAVGVDGDPFRWGWPLAARVARELGDLAAVAELIALLDRYQVGQLAPVQRVERQLVLAWLAAKGGDPDAATAFEAAIAGLREHSTPYHLALGLLDHADFLAGRGEHAAASFAISEATEIGARLGCQPILDRAARVVPPAQAPAPRPAVATTT
jgi:class 3 adenylate cyclase/predicted ATPase